MFLTFISFKILFQENNNLTYDEENHQKVTDLLQASTDQFDTEEQEKFITDLLDQLNKLQTAAKHLSKVCKLKESHLLKLKEGLSALGMQLVEDSLVLENL